MEWSQGYAGNEKTYTFSDYLKWENDVYAEVIEGEFIGMSPSPTPKH